MSFSKLEDQVLELINAVRTDPNFLVPDLEERLFSFQASDYRNPYTGKFTRTEEGKHAVAEAINFLRDQSPMEQVYLAKGLTNAARSHADDIGRHGLVSRRGSDKSLTIDRIERYGDWSGSSSESLTFGETSAKEIVCQWIIGDGNVGRGDRRNIFKADFLAVGVGAAWHSKFEICLSVVWVSDFDDAMDQKMTRTIQERQAQSMAQQTWPNATSSSRPKHYFSPGKPPFFDSLLQSQPPPLNSGFHTPNPKPQNPNPTYNSPSRSPIQDQQQKLAQMDQILLTEKAKYQEMISEYNQYSQIGQNVQKTQSEYSSKYQHTKSTRKSPGAYLSPFKEDKFGRLSPNNCSQNYG
jgi:uncharacterized protein YkwD